jgi:hypothetical protein
MSTVTNVIGAYGKLNAYIGLAVAIIVCSLFSSVGTSIIVSKESSTGNFTIKDSSNACPYCYNVAYGNTIVNNIYFNSSKKTGEVVTLYYDGDISNPVNVRTTRNSIPKMYGVGLVSCALLILAVSVSFTSVISKNPAVAAAFGGMSLLHST